MYYFAYGSNIDEQRMKVERRITFSKRCVACLSGCRLEFNKVAKDDARKGYANIVADDSGLVEGALYDIDMTSLPCLDKYEGYPEHYLKIPIRVSLEDSSEVCAITYIANPAKVRDGLKPCQDYLNHLLAGKDILSKDYFEWLQGTETLD